MGIRVEVFEGEEALVAGFGERVGDGGPVRGAIEQRAEGFEAEVGAFFRELLQVDVLGAVAEHFGPVLGELEHADVARVEVHAHMLAAKAVHEGVHLHRRHEVAVEEDVFDVEANLELLRLLRELPHGLASP